MTAIYSVRWEQAGGEHIAVILENPRNVDDLDYLVAAGAAAAKLHLDTEELRLIEIVDCDGDAGREPRDVGTDRSEPPTSRIVRFRWTPHRRTLTQKLADLPAPEQRSSANYHGEADDHAAAMDDQAIADAWAEALVPEQRSGDHERADYQPGDLSDHRCPSNAVLPNPSGPIGGPSYLHPCARPKGHEPPHRDHHGRE